MPRSINDGDLFHEHVKEGSIIAAETKYLKSELSCMVAVILVQHANDIHFVDILRFLPVSHTFLHQASNSLIIVVKSSCCVLSFFHFNFPCGFISFQRLRAKYTRFPSPTARNTSSKFNSMASDVPRCIDSIPPVLTRPVEMQVLCFGLSRTATMCWYLYESI